MLNRKRIKALREARGWTQASLAKKVGVSVGYISLLEQGVKKSPSLKVLQRLAAVLEAGGVQEVLLYQPQPPRRKGK